MEVFAERSNRLNELAHKAEFTIADWIEITGLGLTQERPLEITANFVRFIPWDEALIKTYSPDVQARMLRENETAPLTFPCSPADLLLFLETVPDWAAGRPAAPKPEHRIAQ